MTAAGFDWNGLKYLLAVAEHGSTIRAGAAFRVSQTTVSRRLEALERALGLKLVDRTPMGYDLTVDGQALIEQAHLVETAARGLERAAGLRRRDAAGTVRITTEEIFAVGLLGPILKDIVVELPELRIELDTSDTFRDEAKRGGQRQAGQKGLGHVAYPRLKRPGHPGRQTN